MEEVLRLVDEELDRDVEAEVGDNVVLMLDDEVLDELIVDFEVVAAEGTTPY